MSYIPEHLAIRRHPIGERIAHWGVALGFVLAGFSGYALFHPALFWMSNVTGGGVWSRILHPYFGLFMFAVFVIFAWWERHDNRLDALDWAWMKRIDQVVQNKEEGLPEVGKYNAGQKMLYVALILCMLGLLLSGVVMWRSYFSIYFSVDVIRLASLLHALCAIGLLLLMVVHIYSSFWIKGSIDSMLDGKVTRGWAYKHHRRWYRRVLSGKDSHS
jgi:formate dehydrogenase subunit gamma